MTNNLINNYFLFTRMIVEHLPKFSDQAKLVTWHTPHKYSHEMSSKSEVVRLIMQFR